MTAAARTSGLPAGGGSIDVGPYLEFLSKEYLGDYLPAGGAAVRFVVTGSDDVAGRWHAGLAETAERDGYPFVLVDAASTRVHMVDQLYAALARQLDWSELTRRELRRAYDTVGLPAPAEGPLTIARVAEHHQVVPRELARSMRRQLEHAVLDATGLAHDFRLVMLRLLQSELGTGEVDADERAAVLAWLRVEPVALAKLKPSLIYTRVGRHNARALLVSALAWVARTTGRGVVLDIDLTRLTTSRRPPAELREGFYYSKAAVLDAYEVLRQLVDATDELRGALVTVAMPPELVTDDRRGLPSYTALALRIVDEVRDRRRVNPFAALIRLEVRLEAVR
jgi:transposase-like protein